MGTNSGAVNVLSAENYFKFHDYQFPDDIHTEDEARKLHQEMINILNRAESHSITCRVYTDCLCEVATRGLIIMRYVERRSHRSASQQAEPNPNNATTKGGEHDGDQSEIAPGEEAGEQIEGPGG